MVSVNYIDFMRSVIPCMKVLLFWREREKNWQTTELLYVNLYTACAMCRGVYLHLAMYVCVTRMCCVCLYYKINYHNCCIFESWLWSVKYEHMHILCSHTQRHHLRRRRCFSVFFFSLFIIKTCKNYRLSVCFENAPIDLFTSRYFCGRRNRTIDRKITSSVKLSLFLLWHKRSG